MAWRKNDPSFTENAGQYAKTQGDYAKAQGDSALLSAQDAEMAKDEALAAAASAKYIWKGTLANDASLAAVTGMQEGDVYRITNSATNGNLSRTVRYDGTAWVTTDLQDPTAINTLTVQLAETASKVEKVIVNAINYLLAPETHYGKAINRALAAIPTNSEVTVPSGVYTVDETIVIPTNKSLRLVNSRLIPTGDFNVIQLRPNSKLSGGVIDTSTLTTFTKAAIYLDGIDRFNVTNTALIEDVALYNGTKRTGIGLYMDSDKPNSCVAYTQIKNLRIVGHNEGIKLSSTQTGNYTNGNTFESINIYDCRNSLILEGDSIGDAGTDGNIFENLQIQITTSNVNAIYTNGKYNKFQGIMWDITANRGKGVLFGDNARYNEIDIRIPIEFVHGDTGVNKVNQRDLYRSVILPKVKENAITSDGDYLLRNFLGDQDNVLAMAHKFANVSVIGKQPITPVSHAFTMKLYQNARWTGLVDTDEVRIDIDFGTSYMTYLSYASVIGIAFLHKMQPPYIRIETIDSAGTTKVIKEISNNRSPVVFETSGLPTNIAKLSFVFKSTGEVRIGRVFAGSLYTNQRSFLETEGGTVFGDIDFGEPAFGVILKSPDGSKFRLKVANDGVISTVKIT